MSNKRRNDALISNAAKKQKNCNPKKPLRFANVLPCKRARTKKYTKDVQNGSETKLSVHWDKDEYLLHHCNPNTNNGSSYQIVKDDNGEYEQIMTRDGDLAGKMICHKLMICQTKIFLSQLHTHAFF